jgi:hypothetical protein
MITGEGITSRFSRSWDITKQTFKVMKADKEILLFPVLSTIFSTILFLIFIFPIFMIGVAGESATGFEGLSIYVSIFAFYFIITFFATFFNAGMVYIAKTRFEGGDATFMDGIKIGFKYIKQIIGWSLLSATVGLILNILQSNARKQKGIGGLISSIVISMIGLAWAIVSVFVVPAIVIKGYGPIEALKKSAVTIKKTWGESLIKYYGLGLVKGGLLGIGALLFFVPAILIGFGTGSFGSALILVGIFIFYSMIVMVLFKSADTIFNTALFLYADKGEVPKFYSKDVLSHAFKKK